MVLLRQTLGFDRASVDLSLYTQQRLKYKERDACF
jgi:hypothetical protein